jgi:mono/diheme cytochrome c family protein
MADPLLSTARKHRGKRPVIARRVSFAPLERTMSARGRGSIGRRIVKGLGILIAVAAIGATGLAVHVVRTWDRDWADVPLPDIHASSDPAVIRRGEYLVFGPAHCVECHLGSSVEAATAAERGLRPPLRGGMSFAAAPLGVIYSKNLTPDPETGIGRYTDGQIARMMRYSVRPNGKASVQLLMLFAELSDADVTAIISYLRTQPPVKHVVPENQWTVVGKVVKSLSPVFKPRQGVNPPAESPAEEPTVARGAYLARSAANCIGCHTRFDPITLNKAGPEFAGGSEMEPSQRPGADPAVWFRTPNLTPAPGSALSKFPDRETFVARFQRGGVHHQGSPMPWETFSRMSAADIGALYEYLHSIAPQPGPTGDPTFVKAGVASGTSARASTPD